MGACYGKMRQKVKIFFCQICHFIDFRPKNCQKWSKNSTLPLKFIKLLLLSCISQNLGRSISRGSLKITLNSTSLFFYSLINLQSGHSKRIFVDRSDSSFAVDDRVVSRQKSAQEFRRLISSSFHFCLHFT